MTKERLIEIIRGNVQSAEGGGIMYVSEAAAAILAEQKAEQAPAVTDGDYTGIANALQEKLGVGVMPSTVKEILLRHQAPADAPKEGEVMELTKKIHTALALMYSMINGGESHSDQSEQAFRSAVKATEELARPTVPLTDAMEVAFIKMYWSLSDKGVEQVKEAYRNWLRSKEQKGEQG